MNEHSFKEKIKMKNKFGISKIRLYICQIIVNLTIYEIKFIIHYRYAKRRGKTFRDCDIANISPNAFAMYDITEIKQFTNSYEASEYFWATAQKLGIFALMQIFVNLKFRNNYNPYDFKDKTLSNPFNNTKLNKEFFSKIKKMIHSDKTGGFIKRSELQLISKKIGYSENTVRINLGKLTHLGFVRKTKSGWVMKSITKVAELIGIELKRLRIKGNTVTETKNKCFFSIVNTIIRKRDKVTHQPKSNVPATISCKYLAEKLGYLSATTASKFERLLERQHQLIIKRSALVKTVLVDSLNNEIVMYKRPCNTLMPVKLTV